MQLHLGMNPDDFYSTGFEGDEVQIGDQLRDASFAAGSNTSGFSAWAGGNINAGGGLSTFGTRAIFWTSTIEGDEGWMRWIDNGVPDAIVRYSDHARHGLSVRCMQDTE